jgi:hypothetical protein
MKHFDKDPACVGTLWKGEGTNEGPKMELHAPRLLSILLWLLDRIRQEGKALMPYEILKMIMAQLYYFGHPDMGWRMGDGFGLVRASKPGELVGRKPHLS